MDNLPNILITDAATSRESKTNQNVAQNKVVTGGDFIVRKSAAGTQMELKAKHKHSHDFLRPAQTFDASAGYARNDVVRVLPGQSYTDNKGVTVNAGVGVWQCVVQVPDQNYSDAVVAAGLATQYPGYVRSGSVNYYPRWPDIPTASYNNPTGSYWQLLGMLPISMSACVNGQQQTIYIGAIISGSLGG